MMTRQLILSRKTLLYTFLIVTISSCTKPIPKTDWEKVYYSIEDLVVTQKTSLQNAKSIVVKKDIKFNAESEVVYDSLIDWEEELEIFKNADLNKPVLTGLYNESGSKEENKIVYQANSPDLEVQKVEVEFIAGLPTKVIINQSTENMLYKTQRTLTLSLEDNLLTNYTIEEKQKLLFREAVNFQLSAQLINE